MQALNAFTLALTGKNLIQASAGTGKTWTISLLYVRLIIEQLLTVDQILVVTYTRAATDELRGRIRERLKSTLQAYHSPDTASAEYQQLLELYPPDEQRLWYLQRALVSFDEAAIFTIHGFCQRVLQQHAFEVGFPFESEILQSDAELQLILTDQFWQQRLVKPHALDATLLRKYKLDPETLLATVSKFIGKPYLHILRSPDVSVEAYEAAQPSAEEFQQLAVLWQQEQAIIMHLLSDKEALDQKKYAEKHLLLIRNDLALTFSAQHDPSPVLDNLSKATTTALVTATKKNQQTPQHPFFDLMQIYVDKLKHLQALETQALDQLRYDLLVWLREQLPERKRQFGLLAFDDLLVQLHQALNLRPNLGEQLAAQYPVALIDEFQDTDPIQYEVFDTIYSENRGQVYYVGDPKQAIYSFRGADIYTYLRAANGVQSEQRYTLARNFRSQPKLLNAFNLFYRHSKDPFANQGRIHYEAVATGGTVDGELITSPVIAPLRIWDWTPPENNAETITSKQVERQIAQVVADDIAKLLLKSAQGQAQIAGRAITSGDFAVLVRSHKQGQLIKQSLQQYGIASVQKSQTSIFQTPEAHELRLVLNAIAEPQQIRRVRLALSTELMGDTASSLLSYEQEPQRFDQELEAFFRWQQLWQTQGFMPMFQQWLKHKQVRARLLTYVDGERRLTNLLHVAELIHLETRHQGQGLQTTLRWLQRKAQERSHEDYQLRLESDENLVQIVTIHKSKGLQYPIVYCPFLWVGESKQKSSDWFAWYDPERASSCLQASQDQLDYAKQQRKLEERSESLRLLYVALTRAQYHCSIMIPTGPIAKFDYDTPLHWLLFGHLPNHQQLLTTKTNSKNLAASERQRIMQAALQALAAESDGCISHEPLPATQTFQLAISQSTPTLSCRAFKRSLRASYRLGSFTSLSHGKMHDRPDYDEADYVSFYGAKVPHLAIDEFARGARAGICLHKMLENLDFQRPLSEQIDDVIVPALNEQGFTSDSAMSIQQLLAPVLTNPLYPKDFSLQQLSKRQRLDELEFYFPVGQLQVATLRTVLSFLPDEWTAIQRAIKRLNFQTLKGYMKGYIDLVFQANGKYYLVDYKSNWLGTQAADYAQAALEQAMADSHYYLQYLIYCVALQRYLRQRIADYSWDEHVGGVYYLFLRGMRFGDDNGIFFHRPDAVLIDALEQIMTFED